jgi:hypothetical protein
MGTRPFVRAVSVGLVGLAVSLPYWLTQIELHQLPYYYELLDRTGLRVGHVVHLDYLAQTLWWLLLAALLLYNRARSDYALLGAALFAGSSAALNISVVTGYVPQIDHFLEYGVVLPVFCGYLVVGAMLYEYLLSRFSLLPRVVVAGVIVLVAILGVRNINHSLAYAQNAHKLVLDEETFETLHWIKENIPVGAPILAPTVATSNLLLTYTPARVYLPPSSVISAASNQELIDRFVIMSKLMGKSDEGVRELFKNSLYWDAILHGTSQGGSLNPAREGYKDVWEYLEVLLLRSLAAWRESPQEFAQHYAFEYVYVGPREEEFFDFFPNRFPLCLEEIYSNHNTHLYRVCEQSRTTETQ